MSSLTATEVYASRRGGSLAGISALLLAGLTLICLRRGWLIDIPSLSRAAARNGGITEQGFAAALTAITALAFALLGIGRLMRTWMRTLAPAVVLTPEGFWDPRVAANLIPWAAIQDITEWQWEGRRGIVLIIEPAVLETMDLVADLKDDRRIGLKGIPVRTRDLAITYRRMLQLLRAYHAQHRGARTGTAA